MWHRWLDGLMVLPPVARAILLWRTGPVICGLWYRCVVMVFVVPTSLLLLLLLLYAVCISIIRRSFFFTQYTHGVYTINYNYIVSTRFCRYIIIFGSIIILLHAECIVYRVRNYIIIISFIWRVWYGSTVIQFDASSIVFPVADQAKLIYIIFVMYISYYIIKSQKNVLVFMNNNILY
jgi:hypothetical protein